MASYMGHICITCPSCMAGTIVEGICLTCGSPYHGEFDGEAQPASTVDLDPEPVEPCDHEWHSAFGGECDHCIHCGAFDC